MEKAMFLESRTATHLHANQMEIDEDIFTESVESDPWVTSEAEDRFATFDPEELEVFDFDEVKAELGVRSGQS